MWEHPTVTRSFSEHDPDQLFISSITVLEVEYGFERQPGARQKYGLRWAQLQADLDVLPFDAADARQTALIRHDLNLRGTPIGPYDLQLAGTARQRKLTLVTNNTAEFERVAGLEVVDWRNP